MRGLESCGLYNCVERRATSAVRATPVVCAARASARVVWPPKAVVTCDMHQVFELPMHDLYCLAEIRQNLELCWRVCMFCAYVWTHFSGYDKTTGVLRCVCRWCEHWCEPPINQQPQPPVLLLFMVRTAIGLFN